MIYIIDIDQNYEKHCFIFEELMQCVNNYNSNVDRLINIMPNILDFSDINKLEHNEFKITIEIFKYITLDLNTMLCVVPFYQNNDYYKIIKYKKIDISNNINYVKQHKKIIDYYFIKYGINKFMLY